MGCAESDLPVNRNTYSYFGTCLLEVLVARLQRKVAKVLLLVSPCLSAYPPFFHRVTVNRRTDFHEFDVGDFY
jgi:tRNA G26 N,N-dimethylase Trm1